jgi:hypothetical protein
MIPVRSPELLMVRCFPRLGFDLRYVLSTRISSWAKRPLIEGCCTISRRVLILLMVLVMGDCWSLVTEWMER